MPDTSQLNTFTTPRISVGGVNLHVRVYNSTNSKGKAEPLLLLHGFTGNMRTWNQQIGSLKQNFQVITMDLVGHGSSDVPLDPARYRTEMCIRDVMAVMDQLGIDKFHLLGYSLGGRVALSVATAHPGRISSLTIESATPGLINPVERKERILSDEALAELIESEGVEAFVNRWEKLDIFRTQRFLPKPVQEELREQRLRNSARGLINSLRALGSGIMPPVWDKLDRLTMPVLLIAGELDKKYLSIANEMASKIKGARIAVVPISGHTVHLERPVEFSSLVLSFLIEVQTRQAIRLQTGLQTS